MARIQASAKAASPSFRVVVHPCGTYEVIDRIASEDGPRMSHLVIGEWSAVDAVSAAIMEQYDGAYLVAFNGQGGDHLERVIHRPA